MRIKSKLTNDVVFNTSNSVALVAGVVVKKVRKEGRVENNRSNAIISNRKETDRTLFYFKPRETQFKKKCSTC